MEKRCCNLRVLYPPIDMVSGQFHPQLVKTKLACMSFVSCWTLFIFGRLLPWTPDAPADLACVPAASATLGQPPLMKRDDQPESGSLAHRHPHYLNTIVTTDPPHNGPSARTYIV